MGSPRWNVGRCRPLRGGLVRALCVLIPLYLALFVGCEDEPLRGGQPVCEPPGELVLERGLKTGFRALSERDWVSAKAAFEDVLATEAGHPEARAGLRVAEDAPGLRSSQPLRAGIVMGAEMLPCRRAVDHKTLRLETRRSEFGIAAAMALADKPAPATATSRPKDEEEGLSGIDLAVLHATYTTTALERFVRLSHSAEDAHFLIDWDGTIYQTLDLSLVARHTGNETLDRRSIAIELVSPVMQDAAPLPNEAKGIKRPMSQRVRVQDKLVRAWGYTAPQMASLKTLLTDLVRLLPDLESTFPGENDVPMAQLKSSERDTIRGIIGALHIKGDDIAPGPGFEWQDLSRTLP